MDLRFLWFYELFGILVVVGLYGFQQGIYECRSCLAPCSRTIASKLIALMIKLTLNYFAAAKRILWRAKGCPRERVMF